MTKNKEKKMDALIKQMEHEYGLRNTGAFDDADGNVQIQIAEGFEDEVRDMIEDAGFTIKSEEWFSGSDFDGYNFIVR